MVENNLHKSLLHCINLKERKGSCLRDGIRKWLSHFSEMLHDTNYEPVAELPRYLVAAIFTCFPRAWSYSFLGLQTDLRSLILTQSSLSRKIQRRISNWLLDLHMQLELSAARAELCLPFGPDLSLPWKSWAPMWGWRVILAHSASQLHLLSLHAQLSLI